MIFSSPEAFDKRKIWVAWRLNDDRKKPPFTIREPTSDNPRCYGGAKVNEPDSWLDMQQAFDLHDQMPNFVKPNGHITGGIGLMLGCETGPEERLGGIDLDTCLAAAVLTEWAQEIVSRLRTYTEISPSGTGLKLLFRYDVADLARLQEQRGKKNAVKSAQRTGHAHPPAIELYFTDRYFATTFQSGDYNFEIRRLSYDDLIWLLDSIERFGAADAASPIETIGSRSEIACGRVCGWLRSGEIASYEDMIAMLGEDLTPGIMSWFQEYEPEPDQRQFHNLWDFATQRVRNRIGRRVDGEGNVTGIGFTISRNIKTIRDKLNPVAHLISEGYKAGDTLCGLINFVQPVPPEDRRVTTLLGLFTDLTQATERDWSVQIEGELFRSRPPVDLDDPTMRKALDVQTTPPMIEASPRSDADAPTTPVNRPSGEADEDLVLPSSAGEDKFSIVEKTVTLDGSISLQARAIYTIITTFVHHPKRTCFPSIDRIAEIAGKERKFVIKYIAELANKGVLEIHKHIGSHNSYTLLHRGNVIRGLQQARQKRRQNQSIR